MAGLFDVWSNDPNGQAELALISGLLSGKGNFGGILGQAMMGAQQAYGQGQEAQQKRKMQDLQAEMTKTQLAGLQGQQADQEAVRKFWADSQNYMLPSRQAPGDFGPGEAPQLPAGVADPRFVAQRMLQSGSPMLAQQGFQGLQKPAATPVHVKAGETFGTFDPTTGQFKPTYSAPNKPDDGTKLAQLIAEQNKYPPTHPLYKTYSDMIAKETTHQPQVQLSINEGQKGLDNELKVRKEWNSEQTYKVYQEVSAAHQQIKAGLNQHSPAGDLAAATKMMKLLDPTSVVRESELAMAMQASGAWDRLTNYAQMRINGTKLTPEQRKDFERLADDLYGAAAQAYNAKRSEYDSFARSYGLDANRVVGPAAKTLGDGANGGFSIRPIP